MSDIFARNPMRQIGVQDVIDEANRAAEQGNWDIVVTKLQSAMQTLGDQAPQQLQQNLAVALANRANKNAEQAMKVFASAREAAVTGPGAPNPDLRAALSIVQAEYQAERQAKQKPRRRRSPKQYALRASLLVLVALPLGWLAFTHKGAAGRVFGVAAAVLSIGLFLYFILSVVGPALVLLFALGRWFKDLLTPFDPYAGNRYAGPLKSCQVCGAEASYEVRLDSRGDAARLCVSHAHALERAVERYAWMSASKSGPFQRAISQVREMLERAEADLREAEAIAPQLDGVKDSLRQLGELRLLIGLPSR
jgi:hypothetical protein